MREKRNFPGLFLAACIFGFLTVSPSVSAFKIPKDIKSVINVEYGKAGGQALYLDLYSPKARTDAKLPVIVIIHGGGWYQGDKSQHADVACYLASCGYAVASINYRFITEELFPACLNDCVTAVLWLKDNSGKLGLDGSRIGLFGDSAGGHLVLMTAFAGDKFSTDKRSLKDSVKCVVAWYPVSDLTAFYYEKNRKLPPELMGGFPLTMSDAYKAASPTFYVSKDVPPALVFHGEEDDIVPIKQTETLDGLMKKAGADFTFTRVKKAGHGFTSAGISPAYGAILKAMTDFFDKNLKYVL